MARRTRKASALKATLVGEVLIDRNAPNAVFFSQADLDTFLPEAIAYDKAIADYEADGCEGGLFDDLTALGMGWREIAMVAADPASHRSHGYGMPHSYR